MTAEAATNIVLGVVFGFWVVLILLEIPLLVRRATDKSFKTISMVLRDYRYRTTSLAFTWASMATHWWVPAPAFSPVWMGILFWLILLAVVVWDIFLWRKPTETWPSWLKVVRTPLLWLVLGAAAGYFLFPQAG